MKVCMLVEALPPAYSGAARQGMQLAAQLRATGTEIFFVGAQVVKGSPRVDSLDGFRVYRVRHTVSGKWTKLRALAGYCILFWRHRREFDILHIHGPYYLSLAAAMFAKYALQKKILLKLTSIAMDTPSAIGRGPHSRLTFAMFRQADAIVSMSSAQYDDCRAHGLPPARLHRIPNGVVGQRFQPLESGLEREELQARLGLASGFHYVVFIGSIEEDKGVRLLVETARAVCAMRDDVKFLLIGPDGRNPGERYIRAEFVEQIRQTIQAAALTERVLLLGRQAHPENYLRVARLFLFTSRSEGFGTVLIEAMAAGLPCVALNIPGVTTDIITSGSNGIILTGEQAADFATAITGLINDPAKARELGVAARQTVLEKFDLVAVAAQYMRVYESLV